MKIFQDSDPNVNMIRSYSNNTIKINENSYRSSLIVTGKHLVPDWSVVNVNQLNAESLQQVCELPIDLLLLGTGEKLVFPDPAVLQPLIKNNIGYEIMDTAAACRTYNVIINDGRKVGAALILDAKPSG